MTATSAGRRVLLGRAGWVIVDQAITSLSNGLLAVLVARASSPEEFGYFAAAFTVYSFVLGVSHAFANQPLVIGHSQETGADFRRASAAAGAVAIIAGAVAGAVVGLTLPFLDGGVVAALGVAIAILPVLYLQDTWRSALTAQGWPAGTTLNDLSWTLLTIGGVLVLQAHHPPAWAYLIVWGAGTLVAGLLGCIQLRSVPDFRRVGRWLTRHWRLSRYLVAEYIFSIGAVNLAVLALGVIGSAADVGTWRGATTLLGPLNVMVFAAFSFVIPELVRRPGLSPTAQRRVAAAVSVCLAGVALAWGGSLLLMPETWGLALLGPTWASARDVVLPITVVFVANGAMAGARIALEARGLARYAFRVNLFYAPVLLTSASVGTWAGGVIGCAVGFAIAHVLAVPVWWITMHRKLGRTVPGVTGGHARPSATGVNTNGAR